ncbi:hypothetical protein O5558_03230 [Escherichia coli]|nr:hypothetical protein [Escherichia coli]
MPHCASPDYASTLFAVLIVIIGGLVTAILHKLFDIPLPVVLGIFSGAVTNTPALGQGSRFCATWVHQWEMVDQMGMSYAMAYPFGICGILFTMWMLRVIFPRQCRDKLSSTSLHAPMAAR